MYHFPWPYRLHSTLSLRLLIEGLELFGVFVAELQISAGDSLCSWIKILLLASTNHIFTLDNDFIAYSEPEFNKD